MTMARPLAKRKAYSAVGLCYGLLLTLVACQPQPAALTLEIGIADPTLSQDERRLVKLGLRRLLGKISGRPVVLAGGLQRPDWWLHWQRQGTKIKLTARLEDGAPIPHTIHLRESRQLRLAGVENFLNTIHQGRPPDE